ncbi:4-alpha-glucanotransferase [Devriesea agamarum]|uniref:4-alpha-glucanotransferase n=1 Tax=Devriesea agamarum TaxID=472569 RepID=UPI00071D1A62|nr:4-alpha-glucanotransferase [Devriesea agamarum]
MPSDSSPGLPAIDTEALQALARELGVGTEYWGWDGVLRSVPEHTLCAVLAALGYPITSTADIDRARRQHTDNLFRRMLPPCMVVRIGRSESFPVHVRHTADVQVRIVLEDDTLRACEQVDDFTPPYEVDGVLHGQARFQLPADLPYGWHRIEADSEGTHATCTLAVVPDRITVHRDQLGSTQAWGVQTQLYSVRSAASWGIGDLTDLRDLAAIAGGQYGADFVLTNPLHAAEPCAPVEASPYLPSTRRFVSALYIRPESVPEYASLPDDQRRAVDQLRYNLSELNLDADHLDRNRSLTARLAALDMIFSAGLSAGRQAAFNAYRQREGEGLERFALWCALREIHDEQDPVWSSKYASPTSPAAQTARHTYARRITFHCWVQWLLHEQLTAAQQTALDVGMRIGIMHDLAVGVHRYGADAWTLAEVLAPGVSVGAPADQYNQQGQNWSQPPWHPTALAQHGYAPFRDLLRTVLRHAGALRIDHILGLFRLWWIPDGHAASDGAYVFYDHEAMIGILALEAQRAGTIIIGEDLGTFEPWVRDYLSDRGILGTSILWFENEGERPLPPERFRRLCLASVNTHDLPPTTGYLNGDHVRLRSRLGLLTRDLDTELELDQAARQRVIDNLHARGLIADAPDLEDIVQALHVYLSAAPSMLLGVSLVDCVGESRIQNQPGTDKEYPNWCIPLADASHTVVLLDDLADNTRMQRLVDAVTAALKAGQHSTP